MSKDTSANVTSSTSTAHLISFSKDDLENFGISGKQAMPYGNLDIKFDPNAGNGILDLLSAERLNDGLETYEDYKHQDLPIVTSQPSVPLDATLLSHPDGWSECLIPIFAKRHIISTPGYPAPVPRRRTPVHSIRPSPIGGVGMFATCSLKAGELILAERAMMVTPRHLLHANISGDPDDYRKLSAKERLQVACLSAERQVEALFARMAPENQKAFMTLHNSHENDGSGPLFGRCRTNRYHITFGLSNKEEDNFGGVFDQLSRINHSCGPNTDHQFDVKSFSLRLYARRDIKEGEELTSPYCGISSSTAQRQKDLEPYGFTCVCPHCLDPESDARRRHILKNFDASITSKKLERWLGDPSLPDNYLIKETKDALALMEKEGVESFGHYGALVMHLCAIYNAIGTDAAMVQFKKYKEKLLRTWIGSHEGPVEENIKLFKANIMPLYRARDISRMMRGLPVSDVEGLLAGMKSRGIPVNVVNLKNFKK